MKKTKMSIADIVHNIVTYSFVVFITVTIIFLTLWGISQPSITNEIPTNEIPCTVQSLYSDEKFIGVVGKGGHYATYYYANLEDENGKLLRINVSEKEWLMLVVGDKLSITEGAVTSIDGKILKYKYYYKGEEVTAELLSSKK